MLAWAVLVHPTPARAQQVTGRQVLQAIEKGKSFLLGWQRADGSWPNFSSYTGGTTALATLALLNAGLPPDDLRMKSALQAVRAIPHKRTYVVSLKALTLAAGDPQAFQADIHAAADWLIRAQRSNGMWGYLETGNQADFSNTQFALLGLDAAAAAGAKVPPSVWRKAESAYRLSQRTDGGFTYQPAVSSPTGSMTAAAIASLYIVGNAVSIDLPPATQPASICCGRYATYRPIARGLIWLDRHFSVDKNPESGFWYYYYLYSLERVGIFSGLTRIGRHDWYREAAAQLVARQQRDGSWREINEIVDTSFALLFLAKGHRPVLVQKLKWSRDSRWNTARNDLAHLVGFIGDRIGGRAVAWNAVDLDAGVQAFLAAPLLYISSQDFPELAPEYVNQLRDYIDAGGTLLVEATCSRPAVREGFLEFARRAFPDHEPLRLTPDHPVFSALYPLDGTAIELFGLDIGCRTSVFFSPADLACRWESADVTGPGRSAFELGANIAAYAAGLEPLPDRLDRPLKPLETTTTQPVTVPPGALYVAVLTHPGDWRPFPRAIPRLADYLSRNLGVDTVPQYEPLTATDPRLVGHPILYMTGARAFSLSADETAALKRHLERGGFLLADACCGHAPFDHSFRALMTEMFPDTALEPLPSDHPIRSGSPGFPLPQVTYLPTTGQQSPAPRDLLLEGITIEGRTAVVYSPVGLGCGLANTPCFACTGLTADDALRTTANILLYALSH